MKVAVYQFASTCNINENLQSIKNVIRSASEKAVQLIVFHECALCGYSPIESKMVAISQTDIEQALHALAFCAKECKISVAVGTVRFDGNRKYNSIVVFDNSGSLLGYYDKKALWGWDTDHFSRGENIGIFEIDHIRVGFRICFDVRFPEPFRELYREKTDLCFVCFSDTSDIPSSNRYNTIKAHLITRAVENAMTTISVNSISRYQTAPTAIFDCNGDIIAEAPINEAHLLIYDFNRPEVSFGVEGRLVNNDYFLRTSSHIDCV